MDPAALGLLPLGQRCTRNSTSFKLPSSAWQAERTKATATGMAQSARETAASATERARQVAAEQVQREQGDPGLGARHAFRQMGWVAMLAGLFCLDQPACG